MRIAIYHPWLHTRGGSEKVVLDIVKTLSKENEITIFTGFYSSKNTFEEFKKIDIQVVKPSLNISNFLTRGISSLLHYFLGKINLEKYDIFIVSSGGIGELICLRNHKKPTIIYCHTPLRAAHQFYDYYMRHYNVFKKILFWFGITGYRLLEKMSWRKIDFAICNSENTRNNLVKNMLINEAQTNVVYPGTDLKIFKPHRQHKNYFLVSGRFKSYKRFELAIDAFKMFKNNNNKFKLIIAGSVDDYKYFEKIKNMAEVTGDIEIKMNVPETELTRLYQNCFAYLFTAKNEDFGIVPVEAMACGKPVIAVNEGGVTETVVNGKSGFLVDADANKFSEKMSLLVKDIKKYNVMSKAAVTRAKRFGMDIFNQKIKSVLNHFFVASSPNLK